MAKSRKRKDRTMDEYVTTWLIAFMMSAVVIAAVVWFVPAMLSVLVGG